MNEPKKSGAEITLGCTGPVVSTFLEAWVLMLVLGGIHDGVSDRVPAVGYWPTVCIVIGLNLLTSYVRKFRK